MEEFAAVVPLDGSVDSNLKSWNLHIFKLVARPWYTLF